MIVAGCDVGSLTAKSVIMENDEVIASSIIRAGTVPAESAERAMSLALEKTAYTMDDLGYVVGTGYGREQIGFVKGVESEISCHAKGVWHLMPGVRTIIDIGGQDAKATRLDEKGKVARYMYNDKCASGTGRFLEIMAEALEIPLEEMGEAGAGSQEKLTISNQCVIFAETEVVSLINEGKETCDIIKALHTALAKRVASLARTIEVREDVVMTGGVAKNSGVFNAIARALGVEMKPLGGCDPQLAGALGAALFAKEQSVPARETA